MPKDSKESKAAAQNKNDQKIAHLLIELSKLDRSGKIDVARAAAGLAGMVAVWPSEVGTKGKPSSGKPSKEGKPSKKVPKQAPNPLAGTPVYIAYMKAKKTFDKVKKQVKEHNPDASNDVVEGHASVVSAYADLNRYKEEYFRLKTEYSQKGEESAEESSETASPVAERRRRPFGRTDVF
jgi:hypothetical protein